MFQDMHFYPCDMKRKDMPDQRFTLKELFTFQGNEIYRTTYFIPCKGNLAKNILFTGNENLACLKSRSSEKKNFSR